MTKRLTTLAGVLIALIGILVPSASLIAALRTIPEGLEDRLLLGGEFFKGGLIVLGILLAALPRLPIWHADIKPDLENRSQERSYKFGLIVLLLVSLGLRLVSLNGGLWLDEILTYVKYAGLPYGEIITTFESENQHFLYTLLTHTAFLIFGPSGWSLRLPAVFFGVSSIWALYLFGREVAGPKEGLLAAALLALSYHHVWFSQNARGYTGLLFWTILSSWLFVLGLRRARSQMWVFYALAAALGVYTHLTMGFILVGHLVIYLLALLIRRNERWPNRWINLFLSFGLAGFTIFLLHAMVIPQVLDGLAGTESVVAEWRNPIWTLLEFVQGMRVGFTSGILAIAALILFGAGFLSYARTYPVVMGLLVLPPLIGASVVITAGHHLWPRFFFFAFGFGSLVVVRGGMSLGSLAADWARRLMPFARHDYSWWGTGLVMAIILISALSVPFAYGPKQDYEGALRLVEASAQPGDMIVTVYLTQFVYENYYHKDWPAAASLEELNSLRARAERTWLVYTFPPVLESVNPDIMESIQREFVVVEQFPGTVGSGTVYVVRADGPPSGVVSQ